MDNNLTVEISNHDLVGLDDRVVWFSSRFGVRRGKIVKITHKIKRLWWDGSTAPAHEIQFNITTITVDADEPNHYQDLVTIHNLENVIKELSSLDHRVATVTKPHTVNEQEKSYHKLPRCTSCGLFMDSSVNYSCPNFSCPHGLYLSSTKKYIKNSSV